MSCHSGRPTSIFDHEPTLVVKDGTCHSLTNAQNFGKRFMFNSSLFDDGDTEASICSRHASVREVGFLTHKPG